MRRCDDVLCCAVDLLSDDEVNFQISREKGRLIYFSLAFKMTSKTTEWLSTCKDPLL